MPVASLTDSNTLLTFERFASQLIGLWKELVRVPARELSRVAANTISERIQEGLGLLRIRG